MGLFNIFKSIKPSKKKKKLLQEHFDAGKILHIGDGVDNIQVINEADYNDTK
jgi:hypothetical protein